MKLSTNMMYYTINNFTSSLIFLDMLNPKQFKNIFLVLYSIKNGKTPNEYVTEIIDPQTI